MTTQLALDGPEYRCLLMDPPWAERGAGQCVRGAQRHYPLMMPPEILRTVLTSGSWRPAPSSHLWVWVTDNWLEAGLWLMGQLGYRYVRTWVWVKMRDLHANCGPSSLVQAAREALQIGLGQYARGSHETLLFGVRGCLPTPAPKDRGPSVILAPRGRHSAKPLASYVTIETVSPGPRVEFFARSARAGWDAWGNEAPQGGVR
jgi:N6-adenosine-specific RNA methylase IME4